MSRARIRSGGLVLAAALLGACATPPPAQTPRATVALPSSQDNLESTYRERAQAAVKDRRWADALVQWEVLALLRPNVPEYRAQVEQTQRIVEMTTEALRAGEAAQARRCRCGPDPVPAGPRLDPDHAEAMQELHELERDRVRRLLQSRAAQRPDDAGPPNGTAAAATVRIGVVLIPGDTSRDPSADPHLQAHPNDEGFKGARRCQRHMAAALAQQGRLETALAH